MKKKHILIAAACVVCVGIGAAFLLGGGSPAEPEPIEAVTGNQEPEISVNSITDKAAASPQPIIPSDGNDRQDEDPVMAPATSDADVEVSQTREAEKPAEAEIDPDPDTHERGADPAPPEPPATTQPPAQQPSTTQPAQSSEPQAGDTNSSGQVWFPGFGWVTPGGENQVTPGHSDGDINKQVGDM
ncbi:hypothetical protein LJC63_09785 [Ruminococcaceae bacterium OttesenSCG-928-L11]|nr:hypothetical protein [Ruminococcaceae bacterium OttesenSCG-928-L11]